jgi:hypothetical protein
MDEIAGGDLFLIKLLYHLRSSNLPMRARSRDPRRDSLIGNRSGRPRSEVAASALTLASGRRRG